MKTIKTNNGKNGGSLVGKSHKEGGIKAIVVDTKRPIKVESGEVIINKHAAKKHWRELSKINQSAGNGVPIEEPIFEEGGNFDSIDKKEIYNKWKELINMSYSNLKKFYDSEEGKEAGLTKSEAKKQGIHSGRESAEWIMKMKRTPMSEWTLPMWRWAKRQISFVSRMSGMKGGLYDEKGNKTRKHTALLIWGHNPEKFENGGGIGVKKIDFIISNAAKKRDKYAKDGIIISDSTWSKYINFQSKNFDKIQDFISKINNNNFIYELSSEIQLNERGEANFNDNNIIKRKIYIEYSYTQIYKMSYAEGVEDYYKVSLDNEQAKISSNELLEWIKNGYADTEYGIWAKSYKAIEKGIKDRAGKFEQGGRLIKRADGHYSKHGLWDSIRENAGSGRKPTKEMLKQEAKLKKMDKGGGVGVNCIDFINNSEPIRNNGYIYHFKSTAIYSEFGGKVPNIKDFCLVTYNSGGQKNLKVTDTINSVELSNEIQRYIGCNKTIAQIIISEFIAKAKRFKVDDLSKLNSKNIIIADRGTIVCSNINLITCKKCNWSWDKKDTKPNDAYICHKCGYDNELKKGIKEEREHIETAKKLYNHKIKPNQAAESIAKEHLKEDVEYYTKLEQSFKNSDVLSKKQKEKFGKVLREFYAKKLYSNNILVTNKKQAIAIAYSEAKNI